MARKKRKRDKKKSKQHWAEHYAAVPTQEAVERTLRQMERDMPGAPAESTPLGQAEKLVDKAFEERRSEARIELAQKALRICPDCASAHLLLANSAPNPKQALFQYELAVAAGERALGPDVFRESVGQFFHLVETRPYMRARLGLAQTLWTAGRRDEAVLHMQDLLRLDPDDQQDVRFALAGYLLDIDRDDELAQLLDKYPSDGFAAWDYSKALLAFRRHGDTADTRSLLKRAIKTNRHVPGYLLGMNYPPADSHDHYAPGDQTEAAVYLRDFLASWKSTPGAIRWLRARVTKPTAVRKILGPNAASKQTLKNLPQKSDVWQAEYRRLSEWTWVQDEHVLPWMVMLTNERTRRAVEYEFFVNLPTPAVLWDLLAKVIRYDREGRAHRPSTLQIRSGGNWESLRADIEEVGIKLEVCEKLSSLDELFTEVTNDVRDQPKPGLLDMPGMTVERVWGFYEAAADFYRQAPWKRVCPDSAIRIACDQFDSGPWYAVLVGQAGSTPGVLLYEDRDFLQQLETGDAAEEQVLARKAAGMNVAFLDESYTFTADLNAAKRHGWPLASPDAHPQAIRVDRGQAIRLALAWELQLLEGCLRAIPEFITGRKQADTIPQEFTVATAVGELKLVLSWGVESDEESGSLQPVS